MLFAIDTSTLIILQKLGWLNLCRQGENKFIWPPGVTLELKLKKSKNKEIFDLLDSGVTNEIEPQSRLSFAEISTTDNEVIALAGERSATVLSEDKLLCKKASKLGLSTISVAGLIMTFYQRGLSSKEECLACWKKLYEGKFLSKPEYHELLQGIMP